MTNLAAKHTPRPVETGTTGSAAEYQNIQAEITKLFIDVLNIYVPSTTTDLLDAGILDSQKFVELLLRLEQKFGARIDVEDFETENFRSIETITNLVSRHK